MDKGVYIIVAILFLLDITISAAQTGDSFSFNYDKLDISETFANIEWNPLKGCDGSVTYKLLRSLRGSVINKNDNCDIPESSYSINKSMLEFTPDRRFKFFVNACCDGVEYSSDVSLEFLPEVTTVEMPVRPVTDVCLQPGSFISTVIWPKSNNSANGSCACIQWFRIELCDCIAETNFYGVYNKGENQDVQICWQNIKNHTRIHFVIESVNPLAVTNPLPHPNINRQFLKSYDIVLAENPSPPSVTTLGFEGRITLSFLDGYDGHSPITHYFVTITDNTGLRSSYTVNKTANTTDYSIPSNNQRLIRTECSPVYAAVQSVNEIGLSEPANTNILDDLTPDVCGCFRNNVMVSVEFIILSNVNYILTRLICNTSYDNMSDITINAELLESSNSIKNSTARCSDQLEYNSLHGSTTYGIVLRWNARSNALCQIKEMPVYFRTLSSVKTILDGRTLATIASVPLLITMLISVPYQNNFLF